MQESRLPADNEIVYSNRRVGSRRALDFECDIRTESGVRIAWQARDISISGLYSQTSCFVANAVPIGTKVHIKLRMPKSRSTISVKGEVARYVRAHRWNETTCGVGIRFLDLPFHDASYLSERIRRLPPPIPARKPKPDYASMIFSLASGKGLFRNKIRHASKSCESKHATINHLLDAYGAKT